jgi:hypothetical protein
LSLAAQAGYEIDRFSDRHGGPEVKADTPMVAGCAGNLFQPVGHVRLCAQVELHVGIYREAVKAAFADTTPIPIVLHEAFIDAEGVLLADGALDSAESRFYFLNGRTGHGSCSS